MDPERRDGTYLQFIADATAAGIAHCSADRRFLFVNKAYAARFGLTPEQLAGRPVVEILGEEAYETIRPYIDRVLDGRGALDAAPGYHPDVIFLDIGMPGLSGYDVARHLREQFETREILIVAMTGWGQEEDLRRSKEAGFDHHLVKPLEPERLTELLAWISRRGE